MRTNSHHIVYKTSAPFGSPLIGRTYQAETSVKYRFGMNTQEKDDEIYGKGNASSAEFWEYDTRLGRRWNLDPINRIWESRYSVFGNCPITNIDIKGNVWGNGKQMAKNYEKSVQDKKANLENANKTLNEELPNAIGDQEANAMESQLNKNRNSIAECDKILSELSQMEASATIYNIYLVTGNKGGTSKGKNSNEIDMKVINDKGIGGLNAAIAHELKHGFQFENKQLSFNSTNPLIKGELYDINDEIEAYSRQMFMAEGEFAQNWMQSTGGIEINGESVAKWGETHGSSTYRDLLNLGTTDLNGNTPIHKVYGARYLMTIAQGLKELGLSRDSTYDQFYNKTKDILPDEDMYKDK